MRDTPRIFRAVAGNAHVPAEVTPGGLGFAGWFEDSPVRVPEPLKSFHPWQPRKETATSSVWQETPTAPCGPRAAVRGTSEFGGCLCHTERRLRSHEVTLGTGSRRSSRVRTRAEKEAVGDTT